MSAEAKYGISHETKSKVAIAETFLFGAGAFIFPPLVIGVLVTGTVALVEQRLEHHDLENQINKELENH